MGRCWRSGAAAVQRVRRKQRATAQGHGRGAAAAGKDAGQWVTRARLPQ